MKRIITILALFTLIFSLNSCEKNYEISEDATKIVVAASPTPHAEILKECVNLMKEKGFILEIIEFDDYILPNLATEDGSVHANFFQHQPYLDDFNDNNRTHLVSVAKIHYEPFGIYSGTCNDLKQLKAGDKIVVPNDGTNEARALLLLEQEGIIKLRDGVGITATKLDIIEDNGYEIVEAQAANIINLRKDAAVVVLNGNYALGANLKVTDALAIEDSKGEAAQTYANVLVVREENPNKPIVQALVSCLKSEKIKNFINNKYNGSVLPI